MSEQVGEPTEPEATAEPLKFDPPIYDYVEKGADPHGYETREGSHN